MGAHMGMLADLRAVGIQIVFDQSAGEEDHGTSLSSLASATCLLGRITGRWSTVLTRPEQASAGRVAHLTTGPMILVFMMAIAQCARAEDACIDPSTLAATTVSITRYFTADEKPQPSLDGYRATAWFYGSTRYLVSIAHFVDDAPVLPRGEWRKVDVRQRDVTVQVSARLLAVVRAVPEGFAIFELREPFPNAQTLKLREKPLSRNEPVRGIAYLDGLRFARAGSLKLRLVATSLAIIRLPKCDRDRVSSRCGISKSATTTVMCSTMARQELPSSTARAMWQP